MLKNLKREGSGSVLLTNRSGSWRSKKVRIRIPNTAIFNFCPVYTRIFLSLRGASNPKHGPGYSSYIYILLPSNYFVLSDSSFYFILFCNYTISATSFKCLLNEKLFCTMIVIFFWRCPVCRTNLIKTLSLFNYGSGSSFLGLICCCLQVIKKK